MIEHHPVHVLSPAEVQSINELLSTQDFHSLRDQWTDEAWLNTSLEITQDHIEIFWLLFQGLCSYFQSASEAKECVLRVATKYDA